MGPTVENMSEPNDDAMRRQMERQAQIEAALSDLPEFMAYVREVMPTLATQKDIENAIVTKLNEYDSGLKQGINSALNAVDTRLKALEEKPAPVQTGNSDGGLVGIFKQVIVDMASKGQIQVPGITPTGGGGNLGNMLTDFYTQSHQQFDRRVLIPNLRKAAGFEPTGGMTLDESAVEHGMGH
jgi:hypothetical protein